MHHLLYKPDRYRDYLHAMRHVRRALRRGNIDEVKAWTGVAERLLAIQGHHEGLGLAGDKREALRAEQPHRLKLLAHRARVPR